MKYVVLIFLLVTILFSLGCDTELGHHHEEEHDHDGDGTPDHSPDEHVDENHNLKQSSEENIIK